jgi:hypothetical protein
MTETLLQLQNLVLYNLQQVIDYADENNLTNSQEFLNFLDKINELSVRY